MTIDGRKDRCDFAFTSRSSATDFSPLPVIAASITSITMRENRWAGMVEIFPEMARLKDMGIVLMTCPEFRGNMRSRSRDVHTIFLWSPAEGQVTDKFPALEIGCVSWRVTWSFGPDAPLDFTTGTANTHVAATPGAQSR